MTMSLQGLHLTADLSGCAADHPWMTRVVVLRQACMEWVHTVGLQAVGECFYAFPAAGAGTMGGVTGMVLLAESHLAVHTWPESGHVTLDVFVCNMNTDNTGRAQALLEAMIAGFQPAAVQRHTLVRGLPAAAST